MKRRGARLVSVIRWPTKAKEAPSLYQVRLTSLDTNLVFQCLSEVLKDKWYLKTKELIVEQKSKWSSA